MPVGHLPREERDRTILDKLGGGSEDDKGAQVDAKDRRDQSQMPALTQSEQIDAKEKSSADQINAIPGKSSTDKEKRPQVDYNGEAKEGEPDLNESFSRIRIPR